jgi:hypothetical protein
LFEGCNFTVRKWCKWGVARGSFEGGENVVDAGYESIEGGG